MPDQLDEKKGFIGWSFSITETVWLITVCVGIAVWSLTTFQTKVDAEATRKQVDKRIETVESDSKIMRTSVEGVAKDVSYIRGRLEPKQ